MSIFLQRSNLYDQILPQEKREIATNLTLELNEIEINHYFLREKAEHVIK